MFFCADASLLPNGPIVTMDMGEIFAVNTTCNGSENVITECITETAEAASLVGCPLATARCAPDGGLGSEYTCKFLEVVSVGGSLLI